MQALQRGARASSGRLRTALRQQQRRLESSGAHGSEHAQHTAPSGPTKMTESMGLGFYVGIACIPGVFFIHNLATSKDPWLTKLISRYSNFKDEWIHRNDLHNSAIKQASEDRHLFLGSRSNGFIDLRNNEVFNTGSPHNVWPGAYVNLDKVVAHYEKLNAEEHEKKLKAHEERKAGK